MSRDIEHRLTPRELQVAVLVKDGLTDREIAEKLFITRRTAEWHVEQIFNKLSFNSRAQVAAWVAHGQAVGSTTVASSGPRHNLPLQLTDFIGRVDEVTDIQGLLAGRRFLTLTGVAGCGKTRLALEIGARSLDSYADGVWLVDLTPLSDGQFVPRAVGSALGVRERPHQPRSQTLVQHMRGRRLLLVFDNCEHVIDGCAQLADTLLRACPSVTLLATSREPLRLGGEMIWRVPPLRLPDLAARSDLDQLADCEAVRLFLNRAELAAPGFQMTEQNAPAIARLCHGLDGLPLAIELAAARVSLMSPAQMLQRLDDRFGLLTGGSRTGPVRHRSLESALDWSHDLLSDGERRLFRRLSVFAGSFRLESVEVVCFGDDLDAAAIPSLLGSLIDKSLISATGEGREPVRFRMLETLRQYGSDRLDENGETEQVRRAHFAHFLELVETVSAKLFTDALESMESLDEEQDNLRSAFLWADSTDAGDALRLAVRLWPYWNLRGRLVEGRETLAKALAHGGGDPVLRCEAMSRAGQFAWYAGDEKAMAEYASQAVALGRTIPPSTGLTTGLFLAGASATTRQEFELAERLYHESIATAAETGLRYTAFSAMGGLFQLKYQTGDLAAGRALSDEMLRTWDGEKNPLQQCILRCGTASEECMVGEYGQARGHLSIGLRLARKFGFNYWGGVGVRAASYVAASDGDYEVCWRLLGASQALRDHVPFSPRGFVRSADYLLEPARAGLSAEAVATLIHEGEQLSPASSFDLALTAIGTTVQ